VIEHEPEGKAALEIAALRDFIFEYLQIIKPSHVKTKGKAAHG
jgi:chromosome partitioning protein